MNLRHPLRVVSPTLDGDILLVLVGTEKGFTGREIQRAVSASQDGVRVALKRLVGQGVVLNEPVGRAVLFSLNREHLAASWIEGLATLPRQLITRLRATIAGWSTPPQFAAVFGSTARGEADEQSDLDLLVIRRSRVDADDATWRNQLEDLARSATAWTGNDARILEYGETELRELAGQEPVLDDVARDGVELAGSLRAFRRAISKRGQ